MSQPSDDSSGVEQSESPSEERLKTTYVKAIPLADYSDVNKIKEELQSGNVLIVKITPLAVKSIEDVRNVIDELKTYVEEVGGDIARLGEERIVVTPSAVRIWRKPPVEAPGASSPSMAI